MSAGFTPSNATSARNYTQIKEDGSSVEDKCTSIDFVGELLTATSLGGGAVQIAVTIPQYTTEPPHGLSQKLFVTLTRTRHRQLLLKLILQALIQTGILLTGRPQMQLKERIWL